MSLFSCHVPQMSQWYVNIYYGSSSSAISHIKCLDFILSFYKLKNNHFLAGFIDSVLFTVCYLWPRSASSSWPSSSSSPSKLRWTSLWNSSALRPQVCPKLRNPLEKKKINGLYYDPYYHYNHQHHRRYYWVPLDTGYLWRRWALAVLQPSS